MSPEALLRAVVRRQNRLQRVRDAVMAGYEVEYLGEVKRGQVHEFVAQQLGILCSRELRIEVTAALEQIPHVHAVRINGVRLYRGIRLRKVSPRIPQD